MTDKLTPPFREKTEILRKRAEALAREPIPKEAAGNLEVLEFNLAYELYAIESVFVREVLPLKKITSLPCTPPYVIGIINVRGQIISVLDIKKFFGLPEKGLTDLNKVIIVKNDEMEFGILADAIQGMRNVALDEIQPPLPTFSGIKADYLKGVTRGRLIVLDAKKILSDETIIVNEQIEIYLK